MWWWNFDHFRKRNKDEFRSMKRWAKIELSQLLPSSLVVPGYFKSQNLFFFRLSQYNSTCISGKIWSPKYTVINPCTITTKVLLNASVHQHDPRGSDACHNSYMLATNKSSHIQQVFHIQQVSHIAPFPRIQQIFSFELARSIGEEVD